MSFEELAKLAALVTAVSGIPIGGVAAAAWRISRQLQGMRTVLIGAPGRVVAGVEIPAIPSIGQRIGDIARQQARLGDEQQRLANIQVDQNQRLALVEAECRPNDGGSMHDKITLVAELARGLHDAMVRHTALPADQAHGKRETGRE